MREFGATLLELLVTLTIVMILASVALPLTRVAKKRLHELELRQHLRIMRAAIDTFKLEWNRDGDVLIGPCASKISYPAKRSRALAAIPNRWTCCWESN